jgi:hypothetical protein
LSEKIGQFILFNRMETPALRHREEVRLLVGNDSRRSGEASGNKGKLLVFLLIYRFEALDNVDDEEQFRLLCLTAGAGSPIP